MHTHTLSHMCTYECSLVHICVCNSALTALAALLASLGCRLWQKTPAANSLCSRVCVCVQIALVAYNCNQIKAFNALCSVQCRLHGVNAIYILVVFGVLLSFHMIIINCSFSMKWLHRRYTGNYCNFFFVFIIFIPFLLIQHLNTPATLNFTYRIIKEDFIGAVVKMWLWRSTVHI